MSEVCHIFDFLIPTFLLQVDETPFLQKCEELQRKYSDIIGRSFSLQFINIYHPIHQLYKEIMSKHGVQECDLTEVLLYSITSAVTES